MTWLKYDRKPILGDGLFNRDQSADLSSYQKPHGFWITDDSDDCWRSWCLSNRFALDCLTHRHEIDLDEDRTLILRNSFDVRIFARKYQTIKRWGPDHEPEKWTDICINWPIVAAEFVGIIITPYQWGLRLEPGFEWYYGWDCASGCIWDASAIKDVRLVEIDRDVASKAAPAWDAEVAA